MNNIKKYNKLSSLNMFLGRGGKKGGVRKGSKEGGVRKEESGKRS